MTSPLDGKVAPFGEAVDKLHAFLNAPAGDIDTEAGSMPNLRKLSNELRVIASTTAEASAGDTVLAIQDRIYPGIYSTPPTNKPHSGLPSEEGDRCTILVGGVPYEHLRVGGGWVIPNIDAVNLARASGSSLVGYDDGTTQDVLDNAKPLADYAALRNYAGRAKGVRITAAGIGGVLQRDAADISTPDDGCTVIVDGTGRRWKRRFTGLVMADWAGFSPSATSAGNRLALQAAANIARDLGATLSASAGIYQLDGTVQLECSCAMADVTISADGTAVSPVIRFGTTAGQPTSYRKAVLPRIVNATKPSNGWGSAGVGLELANCNTNEITIPSVYGFGLNVTAGGYNSGFAYNSVHLLQVYAGKVNLRLKPSSAAGWCNENTWYGGRLGHNSGDTTNWSGTRNIVLEHFDIVAGTGGPNNNLFIRPSVESATVEYTLDIMGQYNQFLQARYEGLGAKRARIYSAVPSGTHDNLFIGGYQVESLGFTFDGALSPYNSVIAGRVNSIDSSGYCFNLVNQSGGAEATPQIQGFAAGKLAVSKSAASTDWSYRLYELGYSAKQPADLFARVALSGSNGRISFGPGSVAASSYVGPFGSNSIRWETNGGSGGSLHPATDNTNSLGLAANRVSVVYAATGSINTSDARAKQDVRTIDEAERAVAMRLRGLLKAFRFRDAVDKKGAEARIHFGVIAQDVIEAFSAEELDATRYALLCHDTWQETRIEHPAEYQAMATEELDGLGEPVMVQTLDKAAWTEVEPAGDRYGVRYEELLAFIMAAQ